MDTTAGTFSLIVIKAKYSTSDAAVVKKESLRTFYVGGWGYTFVPHKFDVTSPCTALPSSEKRRREQVTLLCLTLIRAKSFCYGVPCHHPTPPPPHVSTELSGETACLNLPREEHQWNKTLSTLTPSHPEATVEELMQNHLALIAIKPSWKVSLRKNHFITTGTKHRLGVQKFSTHSWTCSPSVDS